jgi:uncharacterized protein YjdB
MEQSNFTPARAVSIRVHENSRVMKLALFLTALVIYLLFNISASAQKTERGRETKKTEVNFTNLSDYYKAHPQPLKRKEVENEEDDEPRPVHPQITDASQLHRRRMPEAPVTGSFSPTPYLPVSASPADTFESTLDNGTSIPPDTHGAVDANYCVTTINTAVRIQTRTGGVVSTVTLDQFWTPVLPGGGSFDPRVHYDPYTHRWFIVAVSGANSSASSVLLAVSQTSNPTGSWWMYKITAVPGGAYWLDFPNVGFNKKWLVVTGNLFGSSYGGAKVYVFNKASLMSGVGATYTSFTQTSSFSISPAITYDSTQNNLFAAESWNGGYGYMHIWKITGAVGSESMTSVGYPVSSQPWQYTAYAVSGTSGADFAPQSGSTNKLQTNDDRVTQTIFMNNKLWFAHTVFLPYNTTANPTRSAVQWWQTDTLANPLQIGRIDDNTNTNFYAFPSIAVNTSNDALIGFAAFSGAIHPSAAYALHMHTDPVDSMRPLQVYRHGGSTYYKTYSGTKNRWGDYSATALDPVNQTDFWTLQEVASGTANVWDTWWAHVTLSACSTPAITGTSTVCVGSTTTLSNTLAGGTWSSSNTAAATITSTGVVSGVGAGTSVISYTPPGGCAVATTATVNPLPSAITGATAVCAGSAIAMSDATPGGVWSSSNTAVATVSATGIVTGVAAGTTNILYTTGGCSRSAVIAVNASPPAITGPVSICAGTSTTYTDATSGGVWASSNPAIASINASTGILTGISAGAVTISYTLSGGCMTAKPVTINPLPSAGTITGPTSVAAGATIALADAVTGGTWSSSNTAIATVNTTGVVTGVAGGSATITYTVSNSCGTAHAVTAVTVTAPTTNHAPYFTGGTAESMVVCQNAPATSVSSLMTINDADAGQTETWTVSAAPLHGTLIGFSASMLSTGGTLTPAGLTYTPAAGYSGTDAFTIKISDGMATATTVVNVTINPLPSAGTIMGPTSVAAGATIALADAVTGGTWSSSNTAIATVNTTGVVTGVAGGSATITYAVSNSCGTVRAFAAVTVTAPATNHAPYFTGGTAESMVVCQNAPATSVSSLMTINDADAGQTETWTVSAAPLHGTLSGFSASMLSTGGTLTPAGVTYTPAAGYSGTDAFTIKVSDGVVTATTVVNVAINTAPSAGVISGPTTVVAGSTIILTDGIAGGVWTSGSPAIATVTSAGGVVTGVSAGNVIISYTVTNACGSAVAMQKIRVGKSHAAASSVLSANPVEGIQAEVTVFPNPTSGAFTINVPGDGNFYLYSQQGRMIGAYQVVEGANALTLPRGMTAGIYIGRYSDKDGNETVVKIMYRP